MLNPAIMKFTSLVCVVVGALAMVPTVASAATITYNSATTPMVANLGPFPTNFGPLNWAFPEFDSLLGTLQSVRLIVGVSGTTSIQVTAGASATDGLVQTKVRTYLQSGTADLAGDAPGGTPLGSTGVPLAEVLSPTFFFALDPSETVNSGPIGLAGGSNVLYTSPDVLAAFASPGGGVETLTAWALAGTVFEFFNGNATGTQSTTAMFTGEVVYTYEASQISEVPEPSSMLLLGSGLVALGYSVRRKKS